MSVSTTDQNASDPRSGDPRAVDQNPGPSHLGEDPVTSPGRRSRTDFHSLVVASVDPLTDDSAAITFKVPADLAADFAFQPGQSLTVRRGEERRSYSICAPAGAAPRIGVREVADGAVSAWTSRVSPGLTATPSTSRRQAAPSPPTCPSPAATC